MSERGLADPTHGAYGAQRRTVRGCRLVTTSASARILLDGQLRALVAIDWTVVSGDDYPDPPASLEVAQVPMRRDIAFSDIVAFVKLVRLFRSKRFDFVQTHTPKASLLGLPAARLAGSVPIYTMHGSLYFAGNKRARNVAGWLFERWCCAWAARVFLQSREDEEAIPRVRICSAAKLHYIGNGIRLDTFPVAPPPAPGDCPTVLMISRLVVEKGCRDFFTVASALRGRANFVHVGPVELDQRDAITAGERRQAAEAGGVTFVGEVSDVRPYIAASDLVMLPSYREGIPRAATEAAAMSRAVVAYDIRGVREVIPPSTGLLVSVGDVAALTARVRSLLDSPAQLTRLGTTCREAVARFSEDALVTRINEGYAGMGLL